MRANNWDLESAIEHVFAEGAEYSNIKPAVLEKIYDLYKDADNEDLIMAGGIGRFCEDLGVDPSDPITLVISRYVDIIYYLEPAFGAETEAKRCIARAHSIESNNEEPPPPPPLCFTQRY